MSIVISRMLVDIPKRYMLVLVLILSFASWNRTVDDSSLQEASTKKSTPSNDGKDEFSIVRYDCDCTAVRVDLRTRKLSIYSTA